MLLLPWSKKSKRRLEASEAGRNNFLQNDKAAVSNAMLEISRKHFVVLYYNHVRFLSSTRELRSSISATINYFSLRARERELSQMHKCHLSSSGISFTRKHASFRPRRFCCQSKYRRHQYKPRHRLRIMTSVLPLTPCKMHV